MDTRVKPAYDAAATLVSDCRTVMRGRRRTDCTHFNFNPYIHGGHLAGHVQLEHSG
jgi:hypothetical protein